jgi:hypothetical protein
MPKAMKAQQTGFYRLTKGSHSTGFGVDNRIFRANDPQNNIVESAEDLSASMPEKFVRVENPPQQKQQGRRPGMMTAPPQQGIKPPPAPTDEDREIITDFRPMSAEDRRRRAEQLRKRAEELENAADAQDAGEGEEFQAAQQHVREKFAASDAASAFEEQGQELLEREEQSHQAAEEEAEQQGGEENSPSEQEQAPEGQGAEEAPQDDGLDKQNVAQLRQVAARERINVTKARSKDDLVNSIRTHRSRQSGVK